MRRLLKYLQNKHARRRALGDQSGFTLLEVIIALAIMVVAFASILSVESNSINASARAKQMNVVAMLAKNKMTEVEYQLQGKKFEEVAKEAGGNFEGTYADYRWTYEIKEIEFPNLSVGGGKGGEGGDSGGGSGSGGNEIAQRMTRLVTKYLSKSLREVTVKIFWKKGSSEQNFAVSTYWVDLEHEFELSE